MLRIEDEVPLGNYQLVPATNGTLPLRSVLKLNPDLSFRDLKSFSAAPEKAHPCSGYLNSEIIGQLWSSAHSE